MAVQPNYPGVYIDEFTPGAPIEGVGTSTAAFVGTAAKGPIQKPTLIQSWDAFVATFGGFIADPPVSYLPAAVYGFFLNGGTTCYVLRIGSGGMAGVPLPSRQSGTSPAPILVATALDEGPSGNTLAVTVAEASRLASMISRVVPSRTIAAVSTNRLTLTLNPDNAGFAARNVLTIAKGTDRETVIVAARAGAADLTLAAAIPGTVDFNGGTVAPSGAVAVWHATTSISAMNARELTVADSSGFAPGDRVLLTKNTTTEPAVVASRRDATTLVLTAGPGSDFSNGSIRSADLAPGQRTLRLAVPAGLSLRSALPPGAAIRLDPGGEVHTVDAAGGDTVTLKEGLQSAYTLNQPAAVPRLSSLEFDVTISDTTGQRPPETFAELSMHPDHPNYWRTVVQSQLLGIAEPSAPPAPLPADLRPVAGTYPLTGGSPDDRTAALNDLLARPNDLLDLLKPYDEVSLVAVPGVTDKGVQQAVIAHCESTYDRFGILDSKRGLTPGNGIRDQFGDVRSARGFAALYYPWIVARNPLSGRDELWPPSGHIAGVYARSDTQVGVHKAPANTPIRGALAVERRLTNEEQGPLNLMGINVIRVFPGQSQPLVWGARTTAGDLDRNWQYVNIRRLFLYLEESIETGIRWAIFEPNNLQLWQKLRRTISEFLTRVWRDGALFGETADQAFYVRIDEALNPVSTQMLGRLYIEIGVRPTYPAEFIIVRIGIWQGGSEVAEQ